MLSTLRVNLQNKFGLLTTWFHKSFDQALILVHKSIHNQAPKFIQEMFILRQGNPKTLTPGPPTPTTDRVHGPPTNRGTDYPYGPPPK